MTKISRLYTRLPGRQCAERPALRRTLLRVLAVWYWLLAHLTPAPGLYIYRLVYLLTLRRLSCGEHPTELIDISRFPMDSVRHFEFDFVYKALSQRPLGIYLDLSSPRLLVALLIRRFPESRSVIANPDARDLAITQTLLSQIDCASRCIFVNEVADRMDVPASHFDTITSISVIEHISGSGDLDAVRKLWYALKPHGRLYLTVPCSSEAFEEFIDRNEYGLQTANEDGFFFGQRFYDSALLEERIFAVTGKPLRTQVYGEKHPGCFFRNRAVKISKPSYPFWREPFTTGQAYRYYPSVDKLPGLGVIAMEFEKS